MFSKFPSAWSGTDAERPGSRADWQGLENEPTPYGVVHGENKLRIPISTPNVASPGGFSSGGSTGPSSH